MPAIAQKAKALGGKGVVLSYVDKPENFYWREHGVAKLRYKQPLTKEMFPEEDQYSPETPNWVLHSLTSD